METDLEHFKTVRYGELALVSLDGMRIASAAIDPGNRDDVAYCQAHARFCAYKAAQAGSNLVAKRDFLDLEVRWRALALSYHLSELRPMAASRLAARHRTP
jgi:hypothetical protein